jgi:hypothetical protein
LDELMLIPSRADGKSFVDVESAQRMTAVTKLDPQDSLGGSNDPFATAVIPMNARMRELFHFYVTVQLPIGRALNREWQDIPSQSVTLGSAAFLYSIFSQSCGHLEAYSAGSAKTAIVKYGNNETIIPESLAYKMTSISLINKAFADPVERLSDAVYHSLKSICRLEVGSIHFLLIILNLLGMI